MQKKERKRTAIKNGLLEKSALRNGKTCKQCEVCGKRSTKILLYDMRIVS